MKVSEILANLKSWDLWEIQNYSLTQAEGKALINILEEKESMKDKILSLDQFAALSISDPDTYQAIKKAIEEL